MRNSLRVLACLLGSLLAGCTIAEPSYSPTLGGYSMIDEPIEPTMISDNQPAKKRESKT
jgi:hypothetical protein